MIGAAVRYGLGLALVAHGCAHLPGFAVSWRLMTSTELPYKTTVLAGGVDVGAAGVRVLGVLWLLVALGFVAAAALLVARPGAAPLVVAACVLVSANLCILEWPHARIGLFVNAALFVALPAIGMFAWREVSRDVARALSAPPPAAAAAFSPTRLGEVPAPVSRYFLRTLKEGQRRVLAADFQQEAEIFVGGHWRPMHAAQRFTVAPAGFLWDARITMAPAVTVLVRDAYVRGHGSMRGEILGLFPVVSQSERPELDAGSLHRYLAEAVWFPTALLPDAGVRWSARGDRAAAATLTDAYTTVSLEFRFNEDGDVEEMFAPDRFAETDGNYERRPWLVRCGEFAEHDGMRIPARCEVEWQLPSGPRPYWRGRITAARYEFAP